MFNEIEYRRHVIKVMSSGGEWKARALRGTKVATETVAGASRDAAVLAVKELLDQQAARLRGSRGADGYPSAEEVRAALQHVAISRSQRAMLEAHIAADDQILTATMLATAAGYADYVVANAQYGSLGRALAEEMDWEPADRSDGSPIWTFTIATDADLQARKDGVEVTGHFRWRLRPEVAEAYRAISDRRLKPRFGA